jgi:hypothetical protein
LIDCKHCVRVGDGGEVRQTVEVDRGCFARILGGDARITLCIVAAEWGVVEGGGGDRTDQVVAVEVSVPGAGWP